MAKKAKKTQSKVKVQKAQARLQSFSFPEFGVTIKAPTKAEALDKLAKIKNI